MRHTRVMAALVLVPLMSVALASCGDDDERLSKPEFTKKMNALCKERDKKTEALDEVNFFNLDDGSKAFQEAKPDFEAFLDDVSELDPPKDAEETLDRYLEVGRNAVDDLGNMIAAGEAGEQKRYNQLLFSIFSSTDEVDEALDAYGTSDCYDEDEALPPNEEPAAGANLVEVTGTEYAFEIPKVRPGKTAFKLVNKGVELHIFGFGRLKEGATFEELRDAIQGGEEDPGLLEDERISGLAPPDGSAVANADLIPGTYVAYCFIPAPDGAPHLAKGMLAQFEVA